MGTAHHSDITNFVHGHQSRMEIIWIAPGENNSKIAKFLASNFQCFIPVLFQEVNLISTAEGL
jgi:hypothetical protein